MRETGLSGDCGCKYTMKESSQPREINYATSFSPWYNTHSELLSFFRVISAIQSVSATMDDDFDRSATRNGRMKSNIGDGWWLHWKWEEIAIKTSEWCPLYQEYASSCTWHPGQTDPALNSRPGERRRKKLLKNDDTLEQFCPYRLLIIILYIFISLVGHCVERRWRKS
jgi:hypothetical protein